MSCHTNRVIDDLDRRLLEELMKDPRQSNMALSRTLGVSDATVRRRINSLRKRDIINILAVPNASKLGFTILALVALQVELQHIDDIEQMLVSQPNICSVVECTGSHDIFVIAWFTSSKDLQNFLKNQLAKSEGVKRSETFIVMDIKKDESCWFKTW